MPKKKADISIDSRLMDRLDFYCSLLVMKRSQVIEEALREHLAGKVPEFAERPKQNHTGS